MKMIGQENSELHAREYVLHVFQCLNKKAGDVIFIKNFTTILALDGARNIGQCLEIGLMYAEREGWIEGAPNNGIMLTSKGASQI